MTASQKLATRSVVPAQSEGPDSATRQDQQSNIEGRYRTAHDEEAYRRSVLEQANTDIAAGW